MGLLSLHSSLLHLLLPYLSELVRGSCFTNTPFLLEFYVLCPFHRSHHVHTLIENPSPYIITLHAYLSSVTLNHCVPLSTPSCRTHSHSTELHQYLLCSHHPIYSFSSHQPHQHLLCFSPTSPLSTLLSPPSPLSTLLSYPHH